MPSSTKATFQMIFGQNGQRWDHQFPYHLSTPEVNNLIYAVSVVEQVSDGVFNLVIKHELAVKLNVVWVHNLKSCVCGYTTCISGYKTYCDMRYSVFLRGGLNPISPGFLKSVKPGGGAESTHTP